MYLISLSAPAGFVGFRSANLWRLITHLGVALMVGWMLTASDAFAAKKRPSKRVPRGAVKVTSDKLFQVEDAGKAIDCRRASPPRAGKVYRRSKKLYFLSDDVSARQQIRKVKAKIKGSRVSKKSRAKARRKIEAIKAEAARRNQACAGNTPIGETPGEPILPQECVELGAYAGPWGEVQARTLLEKAAWAPSQAEVESALQLGLEATVEAILLRRGGFEPTPELEQRMYDWRDGELGNLAEQKPDDLRFDGVQYADLDNFLTNPNTFYTHLLHLVHQRVAASYRVLDNCERHALVDYRAILDEFAHTGDYAALIYKITEDHLYALDWLNLARSDAEAPNEDFARELLQLVAMGQHNAGQPGHPDNYSADDIPKIARVLVKGWDIKYDETSERCLKAIIPAKAYQGPALTIGIGQPWQQEVRNTEDILRMVISRKETAYDLARWMIESYLFKDPPSTFVRALGETIYEDNYQLFKRAFPTLLKSQALFSSCARKALAKDPMEFMVGFLRATGIPMDPDEVHDQVRSAGLSIWNPTSVFGYPYSANYSARQFIERESAIVRAVRDTDYHEEHGFIFSQLFPRMEASVSEVIDQICGRTLGIDLGRLPFVKEQLTGYSSLWLQDDGTFDRRLFDFYERYERDPETGEIVWETRWIWETKAHGITQVCAMLPDFQSR